MSVMPTNRQNLKGIDGHCVEAYQWPLDLYSAATASLSQVRTVGHATERMRSVARLRRSLGMRSVTTML